VAAFTSSYGSRVRPRRVLTAARCRRLVRPSDSVPRQGRPQGPCEASPVLRQNPLRSWSRCPTRRR